MRPRESFNGRLRDECLNEYDFSTLGDVRQILSAWPDQYTTARPQGIRWKHAAWAAGRARVPQLFSLPRVECDALNVIAGSEALVETVFIGYAARRVRVHVNLLVLRIPDRK